MSEHLHVPGTHISLVADMMYVRSRDPGVTGAGAPGRCSRQVLIAGAEERCSPSYIQVTGANDYVGVISCSCHIPGRITVGDISKQGRGVCVCVCERERERQWGGG